MLLDPIATVASTRTEPLDDDWDVVTAQVFLHDALSPQRAARAGAVLAEFAPRRPVRQPAWSHELVTGYWTAPQAADA